MILFIIVLIALPVAGVIIYRSNKKEIDPIADKIDADAKVISDAAKKL